MIDWISFSSRRNVTLEAFVKFHNVSGKEELLALLAGRGIGPPPEEFISNVFPSVPKEILTTKEEKDVSDSRSGVHGEAYSNRGGDASPGRGQKAADGRVRGQDRSQGASSGNSNRKD